MLLKDFNQHIVFVLFYKGPNHVFISLGVYKSGFIINMSHLNGYVDTKLEVEVKLKESLIRCEGLL